MNKDCKGSLTRELESQNPEPKAEFEYNHAPDPQWKNFTCAVLKIWASGSSDNPGGMRFEWGFYALSASKAIFRARTYNCITYSVR